MTKVRVDGESKEEKFKRIAENRVNKIIKQFELLRNCANPRTYSYSDAHITKIMKTLDEEVALTKQAFKQPKRKDRGFKL